MEAWVHDVTKRPNNAIYDPNDEEVRFGNNFDYAKEDKVIYHEFAHAVADVENGSHYFDPNNNEEGAIGEGIADYFAGSHTNRSRILEYSRPFHTRDMANPDHSDYSQLPRDPNTGDVFVEPHIGGEFFSSVLWDLRNSGGITPHDADVLVFDAIGRVSGRPTFLEYRDAMMAADDAAYGGAHNDLIQDTFAARGVGNFTPLEVNISGPAQLDQGESGTWTATVSNGNSPYSYTWYRRQTGTTSWLQVGSGSSYSGSGIGDNDFQLKTEVTDADTRTGNDIQVVTVDSFDPPEICLPCVRCPCP